MAPTHGTHTSRAKKTHYISSEVFHCALGEVLSDQVDEYPAHWPQPQPLGHLVNQLLLGVWQQLHSVGRVLLSGGWKQIDVFIEGV